MGGKCQGKDVIIVGIAADRLRQRVWGEDFRKRLDLRQRALARGVGSGEVSCAVRSRRCKPQEARAARARLLLRTEVLDGSSS